MSLEVEEIVQSPPLKKRKINLLASTNKCPVMALNEMKSDVVYTFSETGPSHAKIFQSTVVLNNQTFTAQDTTKKKAKKRVAEIILQSAIQLRDPTICNQWQSNDKNPAQDFSSDPSEAVQSSSHFYSFEASVDRSGQPQPHSVSPVDHSQSSPLYYLKRLRPGIKVEIVKTQGSAHARIFTAEVELEDKKYEGIGPNKKQAMNTAAQEALRSVFLVELPKPVVEAQTNEFGDVIARLVESTYEELTKEVASNVSRYKVLAGVVMTRGPLLEGAAVVSIATGSKCISGSHLSMEGDTINDCHAEILARRCLMNYFYHQLDVFKLSPSESIFDSSDTSNLLKLKENISFHMFISSAPCGDARIFTLNDTVSSPFEDLHPNRQGRGTLRTKIESGEGTIPVVQSMQTWDGILQGERLLTMSCSDKVARWNVVGVQGSLLSHLIEPIYLQTIVVGSFFHRVHMQRALIGRIEHLKGLPSPFYLSRPALKCTSASPQRLPSKSPRHSICWSSHWNESEMIDIQKGKLMNGSTSRLCKKSLFQHFSLMVNDKLEWRSIMELHCNNGNVMYQTVKRAARAFGEAKEMLQSALVTARYGQWIKKPLEQDMFELSFEMSRKSGVKHETPDQCSSQ